MFEASLSQERFLLTTTAVLNPTNDDDVIYKYTCDENKKAERHFELTFDPVATGSASIKMDNL
jgi:hypothetical protein